MTRIVWCLVGLLCLIGTSSAMGSTHYGLDWNVIGSGSGASGSAHYALNSTIGQIPGEASSTSFKLTGGFWSNQGTISSIQLISPNGGQNWKRGTAHTITWKYTGSPGSNVKIELLKGTAVNRLINASTSIGSAGLGSYSWNVPYNQVLGTDYRIWITSTSNAAYTDKSNENFTISAGAPITITNPNGGNNWQRGSAHTIKWSYTGNPGSKVKIDLLKGTAVNRVINASTSIGSNGSGSYSWKIPSNQTLGTDYKIRITSTSNAAYTDKSNVNFTISA